MSAPQNFNIVFEDKGGPMNMLFVEVETLDGKSINAGEWHNRADGLWELRIRNRAPQPARAPALVERMVAAIDKHLSGENAEPEFRAIWAELEPVDPDLELVNSVIREEFPNAADSNEWAMRKVALAAIKRVRAEAKASDQ